MIERKSSVDNFIGVYDNYITDIDCNQAIDFFKKQNNFNKAISRQEFENSPLLEKKDDQYFANQGNTDVWIETLKPLILSFDNFSIITFS